MKQALLTSILFAALASSAHAGELEKILADSSKKAEIAKGIKHVTNFLKHDRISNSGDRNATKSIAKKQAALEDFVSWLEATKDTLGVDVRKNHKLILEMIIEARAKGKMYVSKVRKNSISYIKNEDARGVDRFEYAIWAPKGYTFSGKNRGPMRAAIISMHGRAIDQRHPAFRGNSPSERGRKAIYNNWLKHPAADRAIILAPTGDPKGFRFTDESNSDDTAQMWHALRTVLKDYRVDWNRVFLDVQGSALRAACQYPSLFAGVVVRDYIEDRRSPPIPPEEWFILQNLNGLPLVYIADEKNWEKVGKPFSEALKKAYEKAGASSSLMIVKAKRDNNEKLRDKDEEVAEFISKHRRRERLNEFKWRFHNSYLAHPLPVDLRIANYSYEAGVPLEKTAGSFHYKFTRAEKDGKAYNLVEIKVTEVEALNLLLHDGVVDLDLPITIKVNGHVVKENLTIERDWDYFFALVPTNLLMMPFVGSVDLAIDAVAQYTPPVPKEGEAATGDEKSGDAKSPDGDKKSDDAADAKSDD